MKPLSQLATTMRDDWDRRVQHDYRFWISNEISRDSLIWEEGERDFEQIVWGVTVGPDCSALEIGCGVGRMLPAAARRFKSVIGVDVSPRAIAKAQELQRAAALDTTPANLMTTSGIDLGQIETGSIDFVWSFAALPHMPTRVFAAYLCEIRRVLRAGGIARLQVFVGLQESPTENDTLRVRAYKEGTLKSAAEKAGLRLTGFSPVTMPLQELLEELYLQPVVITLEVGEQAAASSEEVAQVLSQDGIEAESGSAPCTDFEAWIALHYADRLYQDGDFDRARSALEYVTKHCAMAECDVRDALDRLSKVTASKQMAADVEASIRDGRFYEENSAVLQRRFPQVWARLQETINSDKQVVEVEVKVSLDGPVVWAGQTCLDHPDKPVLAGSAWAKRTLNDSRIAQSPHLIVVGFGCGYHLESLLEAYKGAVSCIETSIEVLRRSLEVRDLRSLLERLSFLGLSEADVPSSLESNAEIVVRPQSLVLSENSVHGVTKTFNSRRGRSSLNPRIAVLGPLQGGTLPITHYTTAALKKLGQRVRCIDVSEFNRGFEAIGSLMHSDIRQNICRQTYVETISSILLESFTEKPIDILICMAQAPISIRALTELRRKGVITVLWFVEDYLRFTYWKDIAKCFDYVFTIQKGQCIEAIRRAGATHVHYLPTACDPNVHLPMTLSPEERQRWGSPVSFVGAGYHNRRQTFAGFTHLPFKIWGTEWPAAKPFDRLVQEAGRRLAPEEYIKIFNSTDINLNLHSSNERDGVDPTGDFLNPRTFELAACGAFQLVDHRSLLAECFEPGTEIAIFSSAQDLKDKVAYYLERPDERAAIARRSRERVLREHTYDKRLEEMLSTIYASSYQKLRQREHESPWAEMIRRAEFDPELRKRCEQASARGEEPMLDGLIADITTGEGQLTETEQKLLFLFHVRKQIVRMEHEGAGVRN
jgi:spore maturation protein CgeB